MIYTNKQGLPEEFVKALSKQRYSSGDKTDYSVTTLKSPPRIVQLERRHEDEIEVDVSDNLWSLMGNMAHSLLEEHGSDDALTESRMYIDVLGRRISGQVDHYKDEIITDYKFTSAWTLVYGSRIKEWEEQLNLYAYIFRQHKFSVRQIRIVAILRDWDKHKALQGGNYPQSDIVIIPITLWTEEEQKAYIEYRVTKHKMNEDLFDWQLDECTPEEMWAKDDTFALFKKDAKRATKVFDHDDDLYDYCADKGLLIAHPDEPNTDILDNNWRIEVRKGKRTRCEDYCDVNKFCSQYQEYLKEKTNDESSCD